MAALCIAGSGTGVGKTLVTAALAHRLHMRGAAVLALKPVISGVRGEDPASDTAVLLAAQGMALTSSAYSRLSPFSFLEPLAPSAAASREGRTLTLEAVVAHCVAPPGTTLLVETVGGVMTPLTATHTVRDWVVALGMPCVLVVGSYLGSMSHTLTAYAALEQKGVAVRGIVVSQSMEEPMPLAETVASLQAFLPAALPVVPLPRISGVPAYAHTSAVLDALLPEPSGMGEVA